MVRTELAVGEQGASGIDIVRVLELDVAIRTRSRSSRHHFIIGNDHHGVLGARFDVNRINQVEGVPYEGSPGRIGDAVDHDLVALSQDRSEIVHVAVRSDFADLSVGCDDSRHRSGRSGRIHFTVGGSNDGWSQGDLNRIQGTVLADGERLADSTNVIASGQAGSGVVFLIDLAGQSRNGDISEDAGGNRGQRHAGEQSDSQAFQKLLVHLETSFNTFFPNRRTDN